jgi:hypothetical protein
VSALFVSAIGFRGGPASVPAGALAHIAHGLRTAAATPFAIPLFLVVAMVDRGAACRGSLTRSAGPIVRC